MKVDGIAILNAIVIKHALNLPREIVRMGYDEEGDVFYAHFTANAEAVDSEVLADNDNVVLGLNEKGEVIRITILNASQQ